MRSACVNASSLVPVLGTGPSANYHQILMPTPEERARQNIDAMLAAAGWQVQDRRAINLGASTGVAVREFPLKTGEADYLLYVNRRAIGAVEAKPEGMPLSGVESQSEKYS